MTKFILSFLFLILIQIAIAQPIICDNDTIPPILTAAPLSSSLLGAGNKIDLWAIDFIKTYSDNCTATEKLKTTFYNAHPISSLFDKEHYFKGNGLKATADEYRVGKAQWWVPQYQSSRINIHGCTTSASLLSMEITVIDEAGNKSSGFTSMTVREIPNFTCNLINTHVTKPNGTGITGFDVSYEANAPEFPRFVSGDHVLCDIFYAPNLELCITPSKQTDPANGIGVQDLILLRYHILGLKKITNPYTLIAADVNNDGEITAADLTELKKMLYGFQSSFPKRHSWIIIPRDFVFINPQNPWADTSWKNNTQCFTQTTTGEINLYYYAIKTGDLDGNAKP
ncbi:MAG: hypothetical protein IPN29_20805 [Saprospiraceae bacterium]|nr:hypothetical protein [Saprospiraceae bacterium]